MTNNSIPALAVAFEVAADHRDWLEAVRRTVVPADLDLFDICADRGFHLHPPTVLERIGELLDYNAEELGDGARWIEAMRLVDERVDHPSTEAFCEFVRMVDAHMAAVAPPHEYRPYVEVEPCEDDGETLPCMWFTFLDALDWASSTTEITRIVFARDAGDLFARLTVAGPDLADVSELRVAGDAIRDVLARQHYENVGLGREHVLQHLNVSSDAHCRALLAAALVHPRHDLWDLEKVLRELTEQCSA